MKGIVVGVLLDFARLYKRREVQHQEKPNSDLFDAATEQQSNHRQDLFSNSLAVTEEDMMLDDSHAIQNEASSRQRGHHRRTEAYGVVEVVERMRRH